MVENLTIFDEDDELKDDISKDISSIARKSNLDFAVIINKKIY